MKFQYQRKLTLDPPDLRPPSSELEYEGLQRVRFLGIQECLDVAIQRYTPRDEIERLATWSINLTMNFFGQRRDLGDVAPSLDRAIKKRI